MTQESRAAFKTWIDGTPVFEMSAEQIWGEAWQASRKVALEDAAKVCEALACTDDHDATITRHECAQAIRKIK